jgi:type VI secretion system protein ImpC
MATTTSDRFVLAILGDFGGQPRDVEARRFLPIDRDDFDAVITRLGVSFGAAVPDRLTPGSGAELEVALRFTSLDDFAPGRIAAQVPSLASALERRSTPPDADAVRRLRPASRPAPPPSPLRGVDTGSILDLIVDQAGGAASETRRRPLDPALERFVREVAEPALDRTDEGLRAAWREAVDHLIGLQVREILYHPRFQALEAAWRGLHALVMNAETGPTLGIRILDLPRAELVRDLGRLGEREECALTRLLCAEAETRGGVPYAAILGAYDFGPEELDLTVLEVIGEVAARARAPFIAAAQPGLLGIEDFRGLGDGDVRRRLGQGAQLAGWRRFRESAAARHVALCLPRVLLRLPYGRDGEPVAEFTFDEGLTALDHSRFLWGSPALALGRVLTRAFERDGWGMDPAEDTGLQKLPLHVYREDGEARALPCAEVLMSEETLRRVAEEGFIAVASYKDSDEVRFYGVRTVAGTALPIRRPA